TSNIGLYLVDFQSGSLIEESFFSNPGAKYGADVLNRVKAVIEEPSNLQRISGELLQVINLKVKELLSKKGYHFEKIFGIIVLGNPIMIHLFYGFNPASLSRSPFQLVFKGNELKRASDLGLLANPSSFVYTPPLVSAFIGSDILCAVLSALEMGTATPFLLLDLGTNAEITLVTEESIFAASAAAGPAFEEFSLSFDETLGNGFLRNLKFSAKEGLTIISEGHPRAVLASAKIDALAILRENEALDHSGLLVPSLTTPKEIATRILKDEKGRSCFQISPGLCITQEDIRHLQLAKAAIITATKFLIEASGTSVSQIQAVLLAGTFGSMVLPQSAEKIGLIPKGLSSKTIPSGNMAGRGGILFLLSAEMRQIALEIKEKIQVIKLTKNPKFQDVFLQSLEFPP
ncbi:MAG: ASKHA domain-containing protein, partial [bacterium]